jgi:hypothetical protein
MATATLLDVQTKVRRLTRSPSMAQLSDTDLNNYINTFVLFDFPESLRLFDLKTTFTFYTNPFQDVYPTSIASFGGASGASTNPLYDFKNLYTSINPPLYVAGFNCLYTQSREEFFNIYPKLNSISSIGRTGDGSTTNFSGVVNTSQTSVPPNVTQEIVLLQNQVLFSSVDINGNGLALIDSPILDAVTGNPTNFGLLYTPNNPPVMLPLLLNAPYQSQLLFPVANFINYVTGQFTITFPIPPENGVLINSQTVPQSPTRPQAMLYYDDHFVMRPVPDQPYRVQFEAYKLPTQLLLTALNPGGNPDLNQWWQFIAYGAAIKIFQDRMDLESVNLIMPEFRRQQAFVLRRTLVLLTNQRTATIFTDQTSNNAYNGFGWGGPF